MRKPGSRSAGAPRPRVRLVVRLQFGEDGVFGPGKARLLEGIARLGSIAAAAREMEMSYRQAWLLVETMNRAFRIPIVQARPGGSRGGGAALTTAGAALLGAYRRIQRRLATYAASDVVRIAALLR